MLFAVIAALVVFAASLYGWGWAFRKVFAMATGAWAVTLVLGLCSVIFLGGILNVARLAYPVSLLCLVAIGLVLAVRAWMRRFGRWSVFSTYLGETIASPNMPSPFVWIAIFVILAFVVATALPPAAYNTVDDYGKYFFHPVRMLAYGTLYGSPLSDLGSETLGGKAFIDGFVVSLFPLQYINASDAVLGLFLCLALAAGSARGAMAGTLAVLAVFFIDPQWINISALYLGAALIMAAVALTADKREMEAGISPVALGLVYAALVVLKTSFALFVVVHAAAVIVALSFNARSALKGVRFAVLLGGVFLLVLSPWIILYLPHYVTALLRPGSLASYGYGPADTVTLLTIVPLVYGSTAAQFTLLMMGGLVAAVIPLLLRSRDLSAAMIAAAGVAGFAAYIVMFVVFGPRLSGYGEAIRYSVPICIGIVPVVCALLAFRIAESGKSPGRFAKALPWLMGAMPLLLFTPSVLDRMSAAADSGVVPAFPFASTEDYADLNRATMDDTMREKVEALQAAIPAGKSVTIWMGAPFFLDLARNPVEEVDSAGLATLWAELPETDYVIWEYGGYARPLAPGGVEHSIVVGAHERLIAGQEWVYIKNLAHMAAHGTVVYRDKAFVVFRPPGVTHPVSGG